MPSVYLTIAQDLIEHADRFAAHLKLDGFTVKIEPSEVAFPSTPTLLAKKGAVRHFVEVASSCRFEALREWVAFSRTKQSETFVTLVLPSGTDLKAEALAGLGKLGVGLHYSSANGLEEILVAKDLCLPLSLPALEQQSTAVQRLLRPVYRKFDRGEWADGFKDACQLVEAHAKKRFNDDYTSGRIQLVNNGKPRSISKKELGKLTLGQLAHAHEQIVAPNNVDTMIGKALKAINPDRVGAVHRTNDAKTKGKLRRNVSQHMWTVTNALRLMV